ncbi:MAG: phosphoenolpyruvate carboxykinase (ATP) [Thermonemataceae bacterium]
MQELGKKSTTSGLEALGIQKVAEAYWNLAPAALVAHALANKEGVLAENGALMCDTGAFTGRSPKDKFTVKDEKTAESVWWGEINLPFEPTQFDALHQKMVKFLEDKKVYVRDAYAGADPQHRLDLRVVNTQAWHNLFCYNMFLRPAEDELTHFTPTFTIINIPEFKADPAVDGTRQENFAIISFTKRMILIGGTGYAGEMKKGIFTVLNYTLPHEKDTLSMHCSANIGEAGDTAIFFGLSGTGKTTLSADPKRHLIGDDELGWTDEGVFNFEGGCYAKVINITRQKEPQIWDAIKFGAILENTRFHDGTRVPDYENTTVTQNTRTAYPIHHIDNAVEPSVGGIPKNIFFLTADAFGVLPPIAKLNPAQAMYHFISGYTAKVAGTEMGIVDPQTTFSACFGAAFLPLHPTKYAELLGEKMRKHQVNVWLINTGWTGGPYGVGHRMKLAYTRAMLTAAMEGKLQDVRYENHPIFGVAIPQDCPQVPNEVLNPRETWEDKEAYDAKANHLAREFVKNFEKYADFANEEILSGAPEVASEAK